MFFSYNLDLEESAHIKDGKTLEYSRKANDNGKDTETEGKLEDGEFKINYIENKKHKNISFNTSQYDYTTIYGPEFIIDFKDTNDVTLRILDLEYLAIVKRTYHYVKTDTIEVDGRKFTCKVIDLSDLHKTARRWIYRNGDKASIIRQEGRGKDGSYTIKAVFYKQIVNIYSLHSESSSCGYRVNTAVAGPANRHVQCDSKQLLDFLQNW